MKHLQSQSNIKQSAQERQFQFSSSGRTSFRWYVWSEQKRQGLEPCFATDQRFTCTSTNCRWWDECQNLRAEWGR